jgi:hypothetical protein
MRDAHDVAMPSIMLDIIPGIKWFATEYDGWG